MTQICFGLYFLQYWAFFCKFFDWWRKLTTWYCNVFWSQQAVAPYERPALTKGYLFPPEKKPARLPVFVYSYFLWIMEPDLSNLISRWGYFLFLWNVLTLKLFKTWTVHFEVGASFLILVFKYTVWLWCDWNFALCSAFSSTYSTLIHKCTFFIFRITYSFFCLSFEFFNHRASIHVLDLEVKGKLLNGTRSMG